MVPETRYCISLLGTMRKVPLKLPTIAVFMNGYALFQYILPFTINFFLRPCPFPQEALENYYLLTRNSYRSFESEKVRLSPKLFPGGPSSIQAFFPSAIRLVSEQKESFLWQVSHGEVSFFIFFEFDKQ